MNKRYVLLALIAFLLIGLTACSGLGLTSDGGVIPIYRGMSVSSEIILPTSQILEGTTDEIDPVFGDDIDDAFGVITSEEIEYYAQINSTLYITINVYNPDQYEILSFSLNGKKYQSYQFEDGSDSENLILKVETGEIQGVIEYTIDAIKYIDGTEINDVRMDGNQTVKVGIEHTILPTSMVTNYQIGSSSLQFDVRVTDYADLILASGQPPKVFLFDGLSIIREQELTEEVNSISFDSLIPGKEYQMAVAAAYDKVDGLGTVVHVLHQELISTYNMVHINNINASYETIDFDIEVIDESSVGTIQSIDLYLNDTLIESKAYTPHMNFDQLYTGTEYQVVLTYTYDLADGLGVQTKQQSLTIQTQAKLAPVYHVLDVVSTQDSVTFNIQESDYSDVGTITDISLYQGETLVESLSNLDLRTFTNLLSGISYTIKVTYTYDLGNSFGVQTEYVNQVFETQAKQVPVLTFGDAITTVNSVTFDFDVTDLDEIGYVHDISIYSGISKVASLSSFETLQFTNLIGDTQYDIVITYAYDANDGTGVKYIELSESVFTAPYLGVISTEVINTERLTEGDMVYLEIEVDNPSGVVFTSVVINGDTFTVSNVTTTSFIRVEFLIDSTYTGGETAFTVEQINGYNHNQERSFDITTNNMDYAFVNGDISVTSLQILDEDGNSLDQAMPGDIFFIEIHFDNPTGYQIDKLNISYLGEINKSQFTQNEDHSVVRIEQTSYYRNTIVSYDIESFTYSDENVPSKTKNVDGYSDFIVCVTNSNYEYIYTVEDLKNMKDGYAYKLANDIDLSGVQWVPRDVNYIVLDGNGYTISNLRIVKTYLDTHVQLGLFRNINYSSIKNLNVDNVLFMVDLQREATSSDYQSYGGIIAGNSYMTNVQNVNVYGEISINNEVGTWNALGGIFGEANQATLTGVYANVKLSSDTAVGGLIGRGHQIIIEKSHTAGSIYGEREIGGLLGYSYNSKITNSYSNMDLHLSEYRAGGLAGYASTIYIKDSYYEGTIHIPYEWTEIGGLIASGENFTLINSFANAYNNLNQPIPAYANYWNGATVDNVFALVSNDLVAAKTHTEMYDHMENFWDLSIWGFNGGAPVLKWTPSVRIINVVQGETVLTFEIATTDFDEVGVIEKIELYQGTTLIESLLDLSERRFEGLRYNTVYTLKVTYKYNYGDELGDQYIITTQQLKTLPASGTPIIQFTEGIKSSDSLGFDYTVTDNLSVGRFGSIDIYDETNTLVASLLETDDTLFTQLTSDHLYKIVITYYYDLSDGFGEQTITSINYMRTNPFVAITGTNVLNTDALFLEDILVLQIDVDNPDNVVFTKAVINGQTYDVASSSLTRIRVDMIIDESFVNGEVTLVVETLTGTFMGETYEYTLTDHHTDDIFINGDIYIESLRLLDLEDQPIDYLEYGSSFVVEIKLYNPTQYDINSIALRLEPYEWYQATTFTTFDLNEMKDVIRLTLSSNRQEFQHVTITEINYSSVMLDQQNKSISGIDNGFVVVSDDTPVEIWNANDLQNIESGHVYKLMSDIDLSGVSWTPITSFNGVLDGQGHVINNMTMVKSYTDENVQVGLFSEIRYGIVKDLYINNASMVITVKTSSLEDRYGQAGILAGIIREKSIIYNVSVSGDLDVINTTNGYTYTGLMAGQIDDSTINQIYVSGSISGKQNTGGVSGVISRSNVNNTYANVVLTTEQSETGIFAGRFENTWVKDSYARGTVNTSVNTWGVGGLVGYAYNSRIENVVAFTKNQDGNYMDPIPNQWNNTIINSYALTYSNALPQVTFVYAIDQMKLVWDLSIWGFSQEYPTLKKTPNLAITSVVSTEYDVTFEILTTDYDEVGEIYSIELYQNNTLIEALSDLSLRTFTGLRYSSIYTIKVAYRYDYGDGSGEIFITETYKFKTADRENVPVVNYSNVVATESSVSFDYSVLDPLSIGSLASVQLYDGEGLLIETLTSDNLTFDELYSNSNYVIVVNYVYDFNDGWGPNTLEAEYAFTTLAYETPSIIISSQTSTIESVQFALDINDPLMMGAITAVDLYLDNVLVDTLSSFNNLMFDGLFANRNYQVKVTYSYDLNDQLGERSIAAWTQIATQYIQAPWYGFSHNSTATDAIVFGYYEEDIHDIGEITKIELFDGLTKVDEITDFTNLMFTNLYSNHTYIIQTTYSYDQKDGYGLKTQTFQTYVTTNMYEEPIVDLNGIEITQTTLYYEGLLVDPYQLGEVIELSVYLNDTLLGTSNTNTIDIDSLDPNVTYVLEIKYQFDLNDLGGMKQRVYRHEFQTAPFADISETSVLNIGAITIGDTLSLSILTNNPDEIYFTSVVINGTSYPVASFTVNKIRVDLDVSEDLGTGLTTLVVEKLMGRYQDELYTYELSSNNSVDVFINGDIYIESARFIDENGHELDTAIQNQQIYMEVTFYNPTKYDILSIRLDRSNYGSYTYSASEFTLNAAKNKAVISLMTGSDSYFYANVYSYTYDNENIEIKTKSVSGMQDSIALLNDAQIRYIETVNDLLNMQSGYHYEMIADIDMTGIAWTPLENFRGVFDGNGHMISNLTIIQTYTDRTISIGLFANTSYAVIRDLNLVQISYVISLKSDTTNSYSAYVGGLIGSTSTGTVIDNVMVSGDISVNNRTSDDVSVGLLIGIANYTEINKAYTTGSVIADSNVGGLIGRARYSKITNSYSTASFTATTNNHVGALLGYASYMTIENVYASGRNYQAEWQWQIGGIAGYIYQSTIKNSFTYATDIYGNLVPTIREGHDNKYTNVYSPVYSNYVPQLPINNIITSMSSIWDQDIWSFSGELPSIKRVPIVSIVDVVSSEYGFTFDIETTDYDEVGSIQSIALYKDGILLESLTDLTGRSFDELRYGSTYTLIVKYVYNYGDTAGETTIEITKRIKTLDKENVPVVEISEVTPSKESVSFNYEITDTLGVGSTVSVHLYDANFNLLQTLSGSDLVFTNLLSNTTYVIQVDYVYNFNDGFGDNVASGTYTFKTLAKSTPELGFTNVSSTDSTINFNFNETDSDAVGAPQKVDLYLDDVLISTLSDLSVKQFTGLNAYTVYTLVATYTYDLNDGLGSREFTRSYDIKTSPVINLVSTTVMNTEGIISGDTLVLKLVIDNPSMILFSQVTVNGITYDVNHTINDEIVVEIIVDETFAGGNTLVRVDAMKGTLGSDVFNITMTSNNEVTTFINGDVYVSGVKATVADAEIDYLTYYGAFDLEVYFYNPTGYVIESIKIYTPYSGEQTYSGAQLLANGDYTIVKISMSANTSNYYYSLQVQSFVYSNDLIDPRSRLASNAYTSFVLISNNAATEISTAEELQAMTGGHSYILMNNIDLTGFNWQPIQDFSGYFDGNNYTISGLNITKTFEDQQAYVGLFASTRGAVIKNVVLDNINMVVSLRTYVNNGYDIYLGGIVGYVNEYTRIYNVQVTGNFSVNNATTGGIYLGGIAGRIQESTIIRNAEVFGSLTASTPSNNSRIGGIAGSMFNRSLIENAFTDVTIMGYNENGGIVGFLDGSTLRKVSSVVDLTGNAHNGGIVGYANNSLIEYAYASGTISHKEYAAGGIVGYSYYSKIKYVYAHMTFSTYYSWARGGIAGYFSVNNLIEEAYSSSYGTMDNQYGSIGYYDVNNNNELRNVYTLVNDGYSIVKQLTDIHNLIETTWDPTIWDFVNTDPYGNPTLIQ